MGRKYRYGGILLAGIVALCVCFGIWQTNPSQSGKTLVIYCWNNDLRIMLERFYPPYDKETQRIGDVKVRWVLSPSVNNIYQKTLDRDLRRNTERPKDGRIDMFAVEADYVRKYMQQDKLLMSMEELGITEEDMQHQFRYTREAAMDQQHIQRGISWQACPGVMIYRRDIAEKVLGTSDPEKVQEFVSDWQKFNQTAAKMKRSGFHMLAGYFDTYRVYAENITRPWIQETKDIAEPPEILAWRRQTLEFIEKDFSYPGEQWNPHWIDTVKGDVFCYFGPAWLLANMEQFSLAVPESEGGKLEKGNGTFGLWGVCHGPQSFGWGGTWLCAAKGTDNAELVADIMRTICCNQENLQKIATESVEFVNHRPIIQSLAENKDFRSDFLAGQNPYQTMMETADFLKSDNKTPYDQGINEAYKDAFIEYYNGHLPEQTCWQSFLATLWAKYPRLQTAVMMH